MLDCVSCELHLEANVEKHYHAIFHFQDFY